MKKVIRFFRNQKGFTLVELLVVIAILGILAVVAIPNLVGMAGKARIAAQAAETSMVQASMDAMMADHHITAVAAATGVINFTSQPTGTGTEPLYPNFLRKATTNGTYSWTTTGIVSCTAYP